MKKMNWRYAAAWIVVGLLIGFASGWWGRRVLHRGFHGEKRYERILERFSSRLDLTAEQKQQVAALLQSKRSKVDTLRSQTKPQFDDIRNSTDAEISRILTPEQQAKFEKMKARREERRRRHHHEEE